MSSSRDLANKADAAARPVAEVGMGKVRSWGHPLHPATGESLDPRPFPQPSPRKSDANELLVILHVAQSTTRSASSPSPSRSTPSRSPRPSPPASTTSNSSRPPQPSTSCRTTPAQQACSPPSRPSLRALPSCASCAREERFDWRTRTRGLTRDRAVVFLPNAQVRHVDRAGQVQGRQAVGQGRGGQEGRRRCVAVLPTHRRAPACPHEAPLMFGTCDENRREAQDDPDARDAQRHCPRHRLLELVRRRRARFEASARVFSLEAGVLMRFDARQRTGGSAVRARTSSCRTATRSCPQRASLCPSRLCPPSGADIASSASAVSLPLLCSLFYHSSSRPPRPLLRDTPSPIPPLPRARPAPNPTRSAIPLFLYSAYLGGSLVYEYGVGVQRQGEAAEIKDKQEKEQ